MRVLIDYRSALRGRSGAGEYVHHLATALSAAYPPNGSTSFEEGFGLPVLEAMTAGVPVVAANRGTLRRTSHEQNDARRTENGER
ncbi:MAG: hypothetical protein A3H97_04550 [Acidobacteria bacterium RIFCSPLOWO2_02_FULL_65_29]|nr:MAG: hypothetical protein A3H97_04550 [Acidobacteria bacterium RIFCSPLOWO2_02_FULL_65_29]